MFFAMGVIRCIFANTVSLFLLYVPTILSHSDPSFFIAFGVRTQTIVVTGDTVVRSHAPMNTMGVALKVHPGAKLTIRAPTVMMKRREASAHQY